MALLLATASCVDVSLAVIGFHDLLDRDDFVPEADANSAFRALEIAIAMLSWSSSSIEASSSPSISITPSDSISRSSSFSASRAIGEVPWGREALLPRSVGVPIVVAASPANGDFLLL